MDGSQLRNDIVKAEAKIRISEENLLKLTVYARCNVIKNTKFGFFEVRKNEDGSVSLSYLMFDYDRYKWVMSYLDYLAEEIISFSGSYVNDVKLEGELKIIYEHGTFIECTVKISEKYRENIGYKEFSDFINGPYDVQFFSQSQKIEIQYIKEALLLSNNYEEFMDVATDLSRRLISASLSDIVVIEEIGLCTERIEVHLNASEDKGAGSLIHYFIKWFTPSRGGMFGKYHWINREVAEEDTKEIAVRYCVYKGEESLEGMVPYKQAVQLFDSTLSSEVGWEEEFFSTINPILQPRDVKVYPKLVYPILIKSENEWISPCNLCVNRLKHAVSGCSECEFTPATPLELVERRP